MQKHIQDVLNRDYRTEAIQATQKNVRGVRLNFDGKIESFLETLGDAGAPPPEVELTEISERKREVLLDNKHELTKENILKYAHEDELFALFDTFKEYFNSMLTQNASLRKPYDVLFEPTDKQLGEVIKRLREAYS